MKYDVKRRLASALYILSCLSTINALHVVPLEIREDGRIVPAKRADSDAPDNSDEFSGYGNSTVPIRPAPRPDPSPSLSSQGKAAVASNSPLSSSLIPIDTPATSIASSSSPSSDGGPPRVYTPATNTPFVSSGNEEPPRRTRDPHANSDFAAPRSSSSVSTLVPAISRTLADGESSRQNQQSPVTAPYYPTTSVESEQTSPQTSEANAATMEVSKVTSSASGATLAGALSSIIRPAINSDLSNSRSSASDSPYAATKLSIVTSSTSLTTSHSEPTTESSLPGVAKAASDSGSPHPTSSAANTVVQSSTAAAATTALTTTPPDEPKDQSTAATPPEVVTSDSTILAAGASLTAFAGLLGDDGDDDSSSLGESSHTHLSPPVSSTLSPVTTTSSISSFESHATANTASTSQVATGTTSTASPLALSSSQPSIASTPVTGSFRSPESSAQFVSSPLTTAPTTAVASSSASTDRAIPSGSSLDQSTLAEQSSAFVTGSSSSISEATGVSSAPSFSESSAQAIQTSLSSSAEDTSLATASEISLASASATSSSSPSSPSSPSSSSSSSSYLSSSLVSQPSESLVSGSLSSTHASSDASLSSASQILNAVSSSLGSSNEISSATSTGLATASEHTGSPLGSSLGSSIVTDSSAASRTPSASSELAALVTPSLLSSSGYLVSSHTTLGASSIEEVSSEWHSAESSPVPIISSGLRSSSLSAMVAITSGTDLISATESVIASSDASRSAFQTQSSPSLASLASLTAVSGLASSHTTDTEVWDSSAALEISSGSLSNGLIAHSQLTSTLETEAISHTESPSSTAISGVVVSSHAAASDSGYQSLFESSVAEGSSLDSHLLVSGTVSSSFGSSTFGEAAVPTTTTTSANTGSESLSGLGPQISGSSGATLTASPSEVLVTESSFSSDEVFVHSSALGSSFTDLTNATETNLGLFPTSGASTDLSAESHASASSTIAEDSTGTWATASTTAAASANSAAGSEVSGSSTDEDGEGTGVGSATSDATITGSSVHTSGTTASSGQGTASANPSGQQTINSSTALAAQLSGQESDGVSETEGFAPTTSATITAPPTTSTGVARAGGSTSSTKNWLPSSLVMATTPSRDAENTSQSEIEEGSPTPDSTSGLPRAITPEATSAPKSGYTIITVGFKNALNYPFVVNNTVTSAQIFSFLPGVLTFPFTNTKGFGDVTVKQLIPYQAASINYTITVAEVYFPSNSIMTLSQLISSPDSMIYKNPDGIQNTLASLIDSRIPLIGLDESDQRSIGLSSGNNAPVNPNGSMDMAYTDQTSSTKERVAGITVGAAAGCGLYMGLMVLLFAKFRRNNKNVELPLSDSESNFGMSSDDFFTTDDSASGFSAIFTRINNGCILNGEDQRPHPEYSPQLRGPGANNISEPVQASNSLGWYH
ncbi:uncharacterized protein LODBEIA_P01810 [Lodderomyces beijingensis]|uniref:Signaling mucin MSB2 n=1 Tax=Lodderomyces beijingensis TaxID=1775926 RepID=A0ABP0ZIF9_9ASCO